MTLKIAKGKTLPIGIDLGTRSVKMVQLRRAGEETSLLAASSSELPPDAREKLSRRLDASGHIIRDALKDGGFHGRRAVIAVPAEQTFVQHLKIARISPADMPAAVRQELAGKLPFPVGNAVIRHIIAGWVQGDGEPRQEVIAIAAARSTLDAYLDMTRRVKLDVTAVNTEPCAILECFARLFRRASDAERTTLFVDLGATSTQVVLAHGSNMVFARNLSRGSEDVDEAIASTQGLDVDQARVLRRKLIDDMLDEDQAKSIWTAYEAPLDALAAEMTKCLRYYESLFHNRPIERAIFVGGQAYDKRLCQSLAQRLNLPAQIGDPLVRIKHETTEAAALRNDPQPRWAVAVGLSLGAAQVA